MASKTIKARQGGILPNQKHLSKNSSAGKVRSIDDFPVTLAYKKGGKNG